MSRQSWQRGEAARTRHRVITIGNNQLVATPFGYSAGTGYDIATGWGTPDVAHLVADLASP